MIRRYGLMKKITKKTATLLACLLTICLIFCGCGSSEPGAEGSTGEPGKVSDVQALEDTNAIPADGIITAAQFETVMGQDRVIAFTGNANGIEYTWTYDASKIANPQDQNLLIDFETEGLEEIKEAANHANDALKMTMHGKGLICPPTLTIKLPTSWSSNTVLLLKEQNGQLAKVSDVNIAGTEKGETVLDMTVTVMDGDCYIVGGISGDQNNPSAKGSEGQSTDGSQDNGAGGNGGSGSGSNTGNGSGNGSGNKADSSSKNGNSGSAQSGDKKKTGKCSISISCKTILNNMDRLTAGKEEFVPADGWILKKTTVEFTEGDSVHDILNAVCRACGIHMESSFTPAYNSAYVEGINQLYEFDCGELSGWMYKVNGWFPNYGCSKYTVKDGDEICWEYTCDLGKDVGDNSMY